MASVARSDLAVPDAELDAHLRRGLERVEGGLLAAVDSETPLVGESGAYLLKAGGKRFRPMLVLLTGHFGDPEEKGLLPLAVSVELAHLATLHHDDVIDEAESRRGIRSVNARWGNTVAILSGDYLFARASQIAAELGTEVGRMLAETIMRVCEGQIREVVATGRVDVDEATHLGVIERKTASLIATCSRLGAFLAGAELPVVQALERFGLALGIAFQLSDDIMDVVADRTTLGKEPGADLREGVYTLPVILALRRSERREELRALLEPSPLDGPRLARVLEIVRSDGAVDLARERVRREVHRALQEAEALPTGPPREALEHLARFLAARCGAAV